MRGEAECSPTRSRDPEDGHIESSLVFRIYTFARTQTSRDLIANNGCHVVLVRNLSQMHHAN